MNKTGELWKHFESVDKREGKANAEFVELGLDDIFHSDNEGVFLDIRSQ